MPTGGKMPGMAELSSSAGSNGPSLRTCARAVAMSIAIAVNGSVRSANVASGPRKSAITVARPVLGNRWVLTCCRSRATTAPLSDPTEVPATMPGAMACSLSACSIPTCTAPRLAPPPSTYPTGRGRSAMPMSASVALR